MDQKQSRDDIIDRASSSPTVNYAVMFVTSCMQSQEVLIVSEDDTPLASTKVEVGFVRCMYQPSVGSRCHVDAALLQSIGDSMVDIFIQMKPHHRPWP